MATTFVRPASAWPVRKVVYVAGNFGAIGTERINAVTLTDRQIISQRTPIGVDRSWSQAQLNLKLEPGRRQRMPSNGWPAPGRLGVFHAPEVIHGIHREGSLPRRPLLPRDCYGCGCFHPISLNFPFLIT